MAQWGTLSYSAAAANNTNPPVKTHNIIITSFEQPLTLDGATAQSRRKRHFYPRSHMPGDIVVNGICRSQEEYQRLAYFVRHNQWAILGTPNGNFQINNSASTKRMLLLEIPTEQIAYRGFIKTFGMTKKGVHDPAPTYSFSFTPVFKEGNDPDASIGISSRLRQYYSIGTKGDSTTSPPGTTPPPPPTNPPPTDPDELTWVTRSGDTLHQISHDRYGVFYLWINLYRANKNAYPQLVKDAMAPIVSGLTLSTPKRKDLPA